MKKKILYFSLLMLIIISTTGCIKFNSTMTIRKDKSLDFSIIYAMDSAYLGDNELLTSENKSDLEKKGFQVSNYEEGSMKGFNIKRNIKNIDFISSDKDTTYNLSGLVDNSEDNKYVFKVKKGLFKNKYTADFKFDTSNSINDTETDIDSDFSNGDTSIEYDNNDMPDLSNLSNMNMDLSFKVNLPYPAKENNATNSTNNNKELTWNLTSNNQENIKFEFELYNMTTIYITIGIFAIIIIFIIVIIIKNKKNNSNVKNLEKQPLDTNLSSTNMTQPNNSNEQFIQTQFQPANNSQQQINENQNISNSANSFTIPEPTIISENKHPQQPKTTSSNIPQGFIIPEPTMTKENSQNQNNSNNSQ